MMMIDAGGISISLDEITFDNLEKGKLVREVKTKGMVRKDLASGIKMTEYIKTDLNNLYSKGNIPTDKEIEKVLEKRHRKRDILMDDYMTAFMQDNFFRIKDKQELKDGTIVVKFKKVDIKDKMELIGRMAIKLSKKIPKKTIINLLRDSIIESFETEKELSDFDKVLDRPSKPKIEERRGCFNVIFEDDFILRLR